QIQSEALAFIELTQKVYADFGFHDIQIKLSTRPEKRIGSDAVWDRAESSLAEALAAKGLEYQLQPGEGAFYGPKIEFSLKDCLGRVWQCGTLQLDFALPERLGAEYVAEDNTRKIPVMLHRAILGSMERFIGILIEHYAGAYPLWLAPVQLAILNISESQADYARQVAEQLRLNGFRVHQDLRNEKITYKIREHSMQRLPYLLIVGDKEMASNLVAVRTRKGEDLGQMTLEALLERMSKDLADKGSTA
ncbi:MAG: threonine--tRNA ligase, partial [Sulfurimicrobium sp.]|nr:threonine--tRNA ligase [Sulfurimicrobium sp.]